MTQCVVCDDLNSKHREALFTLVKAIDGLIELPVGDRRFLAMSSQVDELSEQTKRLRELMEQHGKSCLLNNRVNSGHSP